MYKEIVVQVDVDIESGFCFGVIRAIQMAEAALTAGSTLHSLGKIVHNNAEMQRLIAQGLRIISHEEYALLSNANVLIRAHGEPPKTYSTAQKNSIQLIDATCPVVLKLQQKIRHTCSTINDSTQVLIFGKKGHAEVNGLVGQAGGCVQVIETIDDIVDWNRHTIIFSQTTMSGDDFIKLCADIRLRLPAHLTFAAHNTICRHVSLRMQHLRRFAEQHDVVVFVCGAASSNGSVLFSACCEVNKNSHRIETAAELRPEWFARYDSVGVCGATSTPQWLMHDIAAAIVNMFL